MNCDYFVHYSHDQIIDILDIVVIVNYILGNLEFTELQYDAANYNSDEIIDILDIMMIVNYILPD